MKCFVVFKSENLIAIWENFYFKYIDNYWVDCKLLLFQQTEQKSLFELFSLMTHFQNVQCSMFNYVFERIEPFV